MVRGMLSVIFISSFFVAMLNAKATTSYGCDSSWLLYPDTGIMGGTEQPNVATEDGCKAACYANPTCKGIDFNLNNGAGHQCSLQFTTDPKTTINGANHWDFSRSDPCSPAGCYMKETTNASLYRAKADGSNTLSDCQSTCLSTLGCKSVDFVPNYSEGERCYLLQTQSPLMTVYWGSNHYDPVCTAGGCNWKETLNTAVYSGIVNGSNTLSECLSACVSTPGCQGVDFTPTDPEGVRCVFMFTQSGKTVAYWGVVHYDYICPEGMDMKCWTWMSYTHALGGTRVHSANTATQCQNACLKKRCSSFDFYRYQNACYIFSSPVSTTTAEGVDHYTYRC